MNQNDKRSKNDLRREHVDRKTGEKHKHRIQQEKINEADKAIKDFCQTSERYFNLEDKPFADD